MRFEDVLHDGRLWAVVYDGDQAIYDTIADAASLSCLILDIRPDADLDKVFRPLENQRIREMLLSREKAKGRRTTTHSSWLRIYAIKLEKGTYLITDAEGIKEETL